MVETAALFPDPGSSANVYGSGHLPEMVVRLLAPFWREARARLAASSYLWFLRYARRGEHLKIRVHGPEAAAPWLRELLDSVQAEFFATLAPPSPGAPRKSTPAAPPIDAEDQPQDDHPDRALLWTRYGRSPLSLGARADLGDERYLALLTRCLGRGAEIVLRRLEVGPDGRTPYALEQTLWLDLVLDGLAALRWPDDRRTAYLLYHRDTLLRYFRRRKQWVSGASAMAKVLLQYHQQLDQLEIRDELAGAAAQSWDPGRRRLEGLPGEWQTALGDLASHVTERPGGPARGVDPYADHPLFPVMFKVFHGVANQIGLDAPNEAFLWHSLIEATAEPELRARSVRLRPDLRALEA